MSSTINSGSYPSVLPGIYKAPPLKVPLSPDSTSDTLEESSVDCSSLPTAVYSSPNQPSNTSTTSYGSEPNIPHRLEGKLSEQEQDAVDILIQMQTRKPIIFRQEYRPNVHDGIPLELMPPTMYQARDFKPTSLKPIMTHHKRIKTTTSHKHNCCPNCGVTESSLWRNCTINGVVHHFCNACGLRFKKGKYCPCCFKVYYDADTNTTEWKQCSVCSNWSHRKCIVETSSDENAAYAALSDHNYKCVACLKK